MFTETPLADEVIVNLDLDPRIPDSCDFVDVKVNDGWVTLKGDVSYRFQSDAAYDDVASLYGVLGIANEITVDA
jgi:osmotically-inducible protein OsmY